MHSSQRTAVAEPKFQDFIDEVNRRWATKVREHALDCRPLAQAFVDREGTRSALIMAKELIDCAVRNLCQMEVDQAAGDLDESAAVGLPVEPLAQAAADSVVSSLAATDAAIAESTEVDRDDRDRNRADAQTAPLEPQARMAEPHPGP
jgi:hypothetical protein